MSYRQGYALSPSFFSILAHYFNVKGNMEEEIWKDVVGYEGLYRISSLGRVYSLPRDFTDIMGRHIIKKGHYMKVKINKQTGYPSLGLSKNGKYKSHCIHRLIAESFIPNPNNLPCVNHIDENRANSVLSNLEWVSYSANNSYGRACTKRTDSLRKTLKESGKIQTVCQYTKQGVLIREFPYGASQVEREYGYDIKEALKKDNYTSHGYVWRYKSEGFSYTKPKESGWARAIVQIDKNGSEIRKFSSTSKAALFYGFDRHKFSRAKEIDGVKYVNGMMFTSIRKTGDNFVPKGHKGPRPDLKGVGVKPVNKYSLDGHIVQRFDSIAEAAKSLGKKQGADIINCCKGNLKTAYGFMWEYA